MGLRKALVVSFVAVFAVATVSAFQAKPVDLTGVWTGSFTMSNGRASTAHLSLTQKGAELTGTAGPGPQQQAPIANGKVALVKGVTTATFSITERDGGSPISFDLKLVEGRLKGTATGEENGEKHEATVDVGRAK
jgi:beta-glucanase (GH16 family)